jgi:hypothetical protein
MDTAGAADGVEVVVSVGVADSVGVAVGSFVGAAVAVEAGELWSPPSTSPVSPEQPATEAIETPMPARNARRCIESEKTQLTNMFLQNHF